MAAEQQQQQQQEEVDVIFAAAERGRTDVARAATEALLQRLPEKGAELLSAPRQKDGATPLHTSAARGHVDVTRALLRAGADPAVRGAAGPFAGRTAFDVSAEPTRQAFVNELYQQVALGSAERTLSLLRAGVDPNALDGGPSLDRPLHWATSFGHVGVMVALLEAGADPNAVNLDGATALHEACRLGRVDAVAVLLRAGADREVRATASVYAGMLPLEMAERSPLVSSAQLRAIRASMGLPHPAAAAAGSGTDANGDGSDSRRGSTDAADATAATAIARAGVASNGNGHGRPPLPSKVAAAAAAVAIADVTPSATPPPPPLPHVAYAAPAVAEVPLPLLWPPPRRATVISGCECVLQRRVAVILPHELSLEDAAWMLLSDALRRHGFLARVSRARAPLANDDESYIVLSVGPRRNDCRAAVPESFSLVLSAEMAKVSAADAAGLYYGTATLCQMMDRYGTRASVLSPQSMAREFAGLHLPAAVIDDWPSVIRRAASIDVRFPYLPTLSALLASVENMAAWRINTLHFVVDRRAAAWIMESDGGADGGAGGGDKWGWGGVQALAQHCQRHHITLVPGWRVLAADALRDGWRQGLQLLSVFSRQFSSEELLVVFSEGVRLEPDDPARAAAAAAAVASGGGLPLGRCLSNLVVAVPQSHVILAGLGNVALSSLQAAPYLPADCSWAATAAAWQPTFLADGVVEEGAEWLAPLVGPMRLSYIIGGIDDVSTEGGQPNATNPSSLAVNPKLGPADLSAAAAMSSVQVATAKAAAAGCGVLLASRPSRNHLFPSYLEDLVLWLGAALCWNPTKVGAAIVHFAPPAADDDAPATASTAAADKASASPGAEVTLAGVVDLPIIYARALLRGSISAGGLRENIQWALESMLAGHYSTAAGASAASAREERGSGGEGGDSTVMEAVSAAVWGVYSGHNGRLVVPLAGRSATRRLYASLTRLADGAEARQKTLAAATAAATAAAPTAAPETASLEVTARTTAVLGEMARTARLLKLSCRLVHMIAAEAVAPGSSTAPASATGAAAVALDAAARALPSSARSDLANSALLGFRELCRGWAAERQRVVLAEGCDGLRQLVAALTFDLPCGASAPNEDLVAAAIFG